MSSETHYPPAMIDDTIDLRPYFLALFRLWPIMVAFVLVAVLAGGALTLAGTPMYEAKVGVAIVWYKTEFSLEPSLETVMDTGSQQAALVELAKNVTIAEEVVEDLGDGLPAEYRDVGELVDMVSASAQAGDLIEITIRAQDPEVAYRVAQAWAVAYERHINDVFVGVAPHAIEVLNQQTDLARADYAAAEEALIAHTAEDPAAQLQRAIAAKQAVIDALQAGSVRAVADLVNSELNGRIDSMVAIVSALQENHALAFSAEQEARRAILTAYTDAYAQTKSSLVTSQVAAQTEALEEQLARRIVLQRIRQNAASLLSAIEAAGDAGAESNALAIALLKSEAFASSALRGGLTLQVDALQPGASSADQVADLRALVDALDAELVVADEAVERETAALAASEGLLAPEEATLDDDPLYQALRAQYQSLFSLGALVDDADALLQGSDLAARRDALSQMVSGLQYGEAIPAYLSAAAPLEEAIAGLDAEVRALRAELETAEARGQELTRARDLARETYAALSRKVAEQKVESELPQSVVRVASEPRLPTKPSGRPLFQMLGLAVVAGLALGVLAVFFVTYLFPDWHPQWLPRGRRAEDGAEHLATEGG